MNHELWFIISLIKYIKMKPLSKQSISSLKHLLLHWSSEMHDSTQRNVSSKHSFSQILYKSISLDEIFKNCSRWSKVFTRVVLANVFWTKLRQRQTSRHDSTRKSPDHINPKLGNNEYQHMQSLLENSQRYFFYVKSLMWKV